MPQNAFVTYFPFDTLDVVSKLSHADKLAAFSERLKEANANVAWAAAKMKLPDYVGFFAVPEYFFLKRYETVGRDVAVELYSETERDALVGRLLMLSDQYSRMVVLPGSISWRRPLTSARTVSRAGKQVTIRYEGLSSTPVLYRGNVLHSYEKVMNDGTIDRCVPETQFVPGTASPVFSVRGLQCGLEICGDFNERNLSKAVSGNPLDFEFMMSATNYHHFSKTAMSGVPVRNGGYFMHVDQAPNKAAFYNGVWCVSRGSGWHSVDSFGVGERIFDPWTVREIRDDVFGRELAVGSVIALSTQASTGTTSGHRLPGATPFAGLRLRCEAGATGPLDPLTGTFEVTMTLTLMAVDGSTSPIAGRTIACKAEGGVARTSSVRTDANGVARAVFACRKDRPTRMTASFHGATVAMTAKLAWVGPGDVTKIATLKGTPHPGVPTYLTPVA